MEANVNELLKKIAETFENISYVKPSDIPNIDLYMDQVTTFMDNHLRDSLRNPDADKIMTKTMINNYAKNDLLPPPVKKKYSKEHVIVLIFIYYFKSFLSISDIQTILNPITDKLFDNSSDLNIQDLYNEVIGLEASQVEEIKKDIYRQYDMSGEVFKDAPEEDREFLRTFAFICAMSFDLYLKKSLIEKIIDDINKDKTDKK